MGCFSLRSLLLAAVVISNCITWTASRHHFTHNASGHRRRHRRQGGGLYHPEYFVIPGGEGGGAWGEWGDPSPCSRSCGGGVASQKRICLEIEADGRPKCTGGDTKYFSCKTQDCPTEADFRQEQCSEFDDKPFKGIKHKWIPYTNGPKPCELNCMPRGERFYYRHKAQVTDGTRCNDESFDVCVAGTCQPVGCDMMLGSNAREDKCRVCRGNGTNCYTVSGRIDTQDLRKGYNDILLIPEGATNIIIEEIKSSNNYLALRSKRDNVYYLNGDYHIDFPRTLLIAGALWHYERSQQGFAAPDRLRCLGPINEPLYLSLLLQDDNVGIDYEYSIPIALAPPPNQQYNWVHDEFTPCSASCGGGMQYRNVTCRSREELDVVDDSLCDAGLKPSSSEACNVRNCSASWVLGAWSPCSKPCGQGGSRSRQVHCQKIITNGVTFSYPSIVDDQECFDLLGDKPPLYQECNRNASCPTWFTGPWKPCDKLCGEGKQTRQVVCHQRTNGRVEVLSEAECADEKPPAEQPCMIHPCEGVDWVLSDWSGCDNCLSLVATREAECATKDRTVVDPKFCENHVLPETEKPCNRSELPPCQVQWYATQWSNCSVECGKGLKTRRVFCGQFDGVSVVKVDDKKCENETKYNDTTPCEVPKEKCPAKWFAGPWSECSALCGGGEQIRRVMCLSGGKEATSCASDAVLFSTRSCNTGPCDKDETLPLNAMSTTVMDDDDYEDCEDYDEEGEEGEEVGAELFSSTPDDIFKMFSDAPSSTLEGSGFTELESEFTAETGSGTEIPWSTEGSGSEPTETIFTDETSESGPTSETAETATDSTGSSDASEATLATVTEATDLTGASESEASTVSSGSTVSDITEATESTVTEETISTVTGETGVTDTIVTEGTEVTETEGSTVIEITGSTVTDETVTSETDISSSTTETASETSSTDITVSTETSGTSSSDVSETSDLSTTEGVTDMSTTESSEGSTTEGVTSSSTVETGSTELGSTDASEGSTTESGTTGSTESEETEGTTETSETGSTETAVTSSTDTTETEITSSTESESTTESGPTTESGSTTESGPTETSESEGTEPTGITTESSSTTEFTGSEETSETEETTPWDWASTVSVYTKKPRCRPRKKSAKCVKSTFGCCPDKKTPAAGPFDEGCPNPKTCNETRFGCCSDGVSPAGGARGKGCPASNCSATLFGCCKSDNSTPAEGNDQEGCPPPPPACKASKYGCCKDGKTQATGPKKKGCPETATEAPKGKDCKGSKFGCCHDKKTEATGPDGQGCPCNATEFGCCPDNITPAASADKEGCVKSCNTSAHGCCPDGETPAHGPGGEGCCLGERFGCCPDNYKPAEGPHLEGCGCQFAHFGCCPDNVTIARGPNHEGCGCEYSQYGCCPDRHTEATGNNLEGCGCHTYQFGCCPDGVTVAKGPSLQGCDCRQSAHGCCGDGLTPAAGPGQAGCDCAASKYGCCPDGQTEAQGEKFAGCTDIPENKQAACSLAYEQGSCHNYTAYWFFDMQYGGCSRFWYGGCEGNGNRFISKEDCEDVCVRPPDKDVCQLPKVPGGCKGSYPRWYYDADYGRCAQFSFSGCLGNANNFESRELCQSRCEPDTSEDLCKLPIERGQCAGAFSRWGYDASAGRCAQFAWGGCGGNANRFGSEAACALRCRPPGQLQPECTQPQEAGNCTDKQPAWSFSQTENRCVPFYYSGCAGNDNRFTDERSCATACPSAFERERCTLPAETGECANYQLKWYFDTASQRCRQFYYGGCGGNGNNFPTEEECSSGCAGTQPTTTQRPQEPEPFRQEFCFLETNPGPCSGNETRWAYSAETGDCQPFRYGGCDGNRNNFPSKEYCTYYCQPSQDVCQLPMRTGPCRASLPRWFYDASSDRCSQFAYGGCDGNGNNFQSAEECERRCRSGPAPAPSPSTPTLTTTTITPEMSSACSASGIERCAGVGRVWHLDPATGACAARDTPPGAPACDAPGAFPSPEACERSCGAFRGLNVCRYPKDAGSCTDLQPKFYFDAASRSCQPFTYGGCYGGPNRFSSIDECEDVCLPQTDPCKQPPERGGCAGYHVMWYYNEARDDCQQFAWTGCDGNGNRFESREECEGQCRRAPAPPAATPSPSTTHRTPELDDECRTPESLAPCGEEQLSFYYDAARGACARAQFGACRHPNSYRTEEECERRCGAFKGIDVCRVPLDPGPCRDSVPKLHWDIEEGRCKPFSYGGCRGGPNRFSTEAECEEVCGHLAIDPACRLEAAVGRACGPGGGAGERRWYRSGFHGECREFIYLGCGGNRNNFRSLQECERHCGPPSSDDETENEIIPVDCTAAREACAALACDYGLNRTRQPDGCESCSCLEHPCAGARCPAGSRCVPGARRDPATSRTSYTAECVPDDTSNEIVPADNCRAVTDECDALQCQYGVQRERQPDGCERCVCAEHPCRDKQCPAGARCAAAAGRDPLSDEIRYTADCRTVDKPGQCPAEEAEEPAAGACRRECNDDADCRGAAKCCRAGCSQLCREPASYQPDQPQAPEANPETETEVSSEEGGLATLRCLFHSNPPPKISWRRGQITIDGSAGRYRLTSDGALQIVSLYRNDSGVYICVAENELGSAQQEVVLRVNDPKEGAAGIAGEPSAAVVGEIGRPLSIRCLAYGHPQPSIFWYRGPTGPMVPYDSKVYEARGNVLLIRALDVAALGEYTCQAYNGVTKPASWTVVVRAPRRDPGWPASAYLLPTTAPRPAPRPADPARSTAQPIVEFPQVPVYTVPVRTQLRAAQTTLAAGGELSLPCEVDGHPEPDVHWTKDGVPLEESDRIHMTAARLTVSGVSANDSGEYGCHASNGHTSHSSTVRIEVQELHIPAQCTDNQFFANCQLIVRSKFCNHRYYSSFCCKSCVEAGLLNPQDLQLQPSPAWTKK